MKTERFDGEFRRKMLGLPTETDAGDVDRIFGYVAANRPGKSGFGWEKVLFYGTVAVLIGSLLYNIDQHHMNKHLYSSLDSLKQQYAANSLPTHSITDNGAVNRPDTVYITRYQDRSMAELPRQTEPAGMLDRKDGQSIQLPSDGANLSVTTNQRNGPMSAVSQVGTPLGKESPKGPDLAGIALTQATDSVLTDPNRSLAVSTNDRGMSESADGEKPVSDSRQKGGTARLSTRQQTDYPLVVTKPQVTQPGQTEKTKYVRTESGSSEAAMDPVSEPSGVVTLTADFLSARSLPHYTLTNSLTGLVKAVPITSGLTARHRLHWAFPKVAVAGSSLWAGAGVSLGHDQLSGSGLGEWRLNSHWSIQTGVQLTLQGDHFFSDDDFQKRTRQDFRTLYAPGIPSSYELLDISQSYQLVQLPLTIAYHYPLGHDWALRFGVGTSLNLYAQNRVEYDYRGNSRSFDHGLYRAAVPVSLVNTVMVLAGIERRWQGWLFRISPFVSPQPTPITQDHERLFWGLQAGILHRFGGQ